jgi:hypothetical protein
MVSDANYLSYRKFLRQMQWFINSWFGLPFKKFFFVNLKSKMAITAGQCFNTGTCGNMQNKIYFFE